MKGSDSSKAGLPGNPWHSLYQMQRLSKNVRQNLKNITAPTVCLHAFNDDIADRKNSQIIYDHVSGPKKIVWLYESYHMITIDNDRKQVIDESLKFIRRSQKVFPTTFSTQQNVELELHDNLGELA